MALDRESNCVVTRQRTITEEVIAVRESLVMIERVGDQLHVTVEQLDAGNKVLATERYVIAGADYDEIMSASPPWAPEKPADDYRSDDIWYVIDRLRAAEQAS